MRRALRLTAFAVFTATLVGESGTSVAAGTVTTFAGSGVPGMVDGPGAAARFLMPTDLAYAPDGTLIVVDSAAQRIRAVSPAGIVSTIAGSGSLSGNGLEVAPGYRDGDARAAQFNWPRGVAVSPDGTVYIADTGNHCVRAIKGGTVRTVAGDPRHAGTPFSRPTGIAVSVGGNLYVADPDAGMMQVDTAGSVTRIAGFRGPYSVAVLPSPAGEFLFGADADGIYERLPYEPTDYRYFSLNRPEGTAPATSDPKRTLIERITTFDNPVGYPGSLLVSGYDMFFGDVRTNSIRYLWSGWAPMMRVLAGPPNEDASNETAGFADGPGSGARFNAPMGLAVRDRTTLMIADTGNRRIRMLRYDIASEVEATRGQQLDVESGSQSGDEDYGIAMVGNSFVAYDAAWADSVPGLIQRRLRADHVLAAQHLRPSLRMGGGLNGIDQLDSLAKTIASTASYRAVLLNLNLLNFGGLLPFKTPTASMAEAVTHLQYARKVLADAGIPLVAVVHPVAEEVSAGDVLPTRMASGGMQPVNAGHVFMVAAAKAAGVDVIDVYPDFQAYEAAPAEPLFGTTNEHFARAGRALMAEATARGLEALQPWARAK